MSEQDQLQAKLLQSQLELENLRFEMQKIQTELAQAQGLIAAMETSKFWQLRVKWLRTKALIIQLLRLKQLKDNLVRAKNKTLTALKLTTSNAFNQSNIEHLPYQQEITTQEKLEVDDQLTLDQIKISAKSRHPELLALSGISTKNFWEILEPILQQNLSTLDLLNQPQISILTPTFNSSLDWFIETVISVLKQTSSSWEWCIVDDGSSSEDIRSVLAELTQKHPRIQVTFQVSGGISAATNQALAAATANYICFLDHDDTLTENAIQELLDKLSEGYDAVYSDEDKIDPSGLQYVEPFFKPDWSPEYLRGVMYVGHLLCVRRDLALKIGGLDRQFDGVQDYEFMLRLAELAPKVGHISKILYHWRQIPGSIAIDIAAKPKIEELQEAAINAHLKRLALPAVARSIGNHRVSISPLPRGESPLISIIIPTKDAPEHLGRCLNSLFSMSAYSSFEVLLIDNETSDPQALQIMKQFPVRRLQLTNPFNYSRANNLGAKYAKGDYLVFLNNDTEVITADWLEHLLYYAEQPEIGAVGGLLLFPGKTVQHAGVILGPRGTADHVMRDFPCDVDGYAGSLVCAREASAVTAACLMVKKDLFNEIGGFNEHFFTHYQDVDLCLKLVALGKKNIFTPRAVLIHHESATRKDYYDVVDRFLLLDQWQDYIDQGDPFFNSNFDIDLCNYSIKTQ